MSSPSTRAATLVSGSPTETEKIGRAIGGSCRGGEVIALVGDLGTGKTRLVKGIAIGLGIDPARVTSPTFVLHQRHVARGLRLDHVDAYRLSAAREWDALGLEQSPSAVLAVEWADRIDAALPSGRLEIRMEVLGANRRRLDLDARGAPAERLLHEALKTLSAKS
jgi:tRNA threonylcarbamoyladenosine biosynthesis protein TsaE